MAATQNDSNGEDELSAMVIFDNLEPFVLVHLRNVYVCLSLGMVSASFGAYIDFIVQLGEWQFLTTTASVVLILWVAFTKHSKENMFTRLVIFNGFTLFSGISIGPLLDMVVSIEPRIISTALLSTAVVFIGLTLTAFLNSDRKFLYMGGLLFSCMFLLMLVGFLNMFIGSRIVFDAYVYCNLVMLLMFVLYDTQNMIDKRRHGEKDFIWHALALFLDVFQLFRVILIILAKKEVSKNRRQDN